MKSEQTSATAVLIHIWAVRWQICPADWQQKLSSAMPVNAFKSKRVDTNLIQHTSTLILYTAGGVQKAAYKPCHVAATQSLYWLGLFKLIDMRTYEGILFKWSIPLDLSFWFNCFEKRNLFLCISDTCVEILYLKHKMLRTMTSSSFWQAVSHICFLGESNSVYARCVLKAEKNCSLQAIGLIYC